ncbi:MAG: 4'-phosphopantetheinyl transferase superfamily protein [Erysipelotrichaceae bacterium]|nr:4'-phosphopantetheinyl transferase superfamily protein [Erysipelotrichaceae bacterium]
MIKGIGIDTVTISEIGRFLDSETIAKKVFTKRENEIAKLEDDQADYYSRCFATKEAAFKVK